MLTSSFKNKRGFTLLETMIALMLFLLLTLVFAAGIPLAKRSSNTNGQYSIALSLCQHKIDQMRASGYGDIGILDRLKERKICDSTTTNVNQFTFTKLIQSEIDSLSNSAQTKGRNLIDPTGTVIVLTNSNAAYMEKKVIVTVSWKNTVNDTTYRRVSVVASINDYY